MAAGVIMSGLMLATGRGLPRPRLWGPLALLGFLMNIVGNGFVVQQSPEPGAALVAGGGVVLKLERRVPATAGGAEQ